MDGMASRAGTEEDRPSLQFYHVRLRPPSVLMYIYTHTHTRIHIYIYNISERKA